MTQEELIRYKIKKIVRVLRHNEEDELVALIISLVDGSKTYSDIKTEVIADKEGQLASIEQFKTKISSDLSELKK